jgi:hypothetical protein
MGKPPMPDAYLVAVNPPPNHDALAARLDAAIAAAWSALEDYDHRQQRTSVHDGIVDCLSHLQQMQQILGHPVAPEWPGEPGVVTIARQILPRLQDHPKGLTRTMISGRFKPSRRKLVGPALQMLETHGWAHCVRHATGGRPIEVWLAATRNHNGDAIVD